MIHSATYQNIRQAVDRAFELFPLKVKGKKIFIKPNVLRAAKAEEGITTHPAVLRAVVEKIETMQPAAIVAGDNPGAFNYGANEESFEKTGLLEAAGPYYQNIGSDSQNVDFNADFHAHGESFPHRAGSRYHHQSAKIQNPWSHDPERCDKEQLRFFTRCPESQIAQSGRQSQTLP